MFRNGIESPPGAHAREFTLSSILIFQPSLLTYVSLEFPEHAKSRKAPSDEE